MNIALSAITRALVGAVALCTLSTVSVRAQGTAVTAHDAWVREAPAGRKVTGIFLTLENKGTVARALVSGSTQVADTLELHEMIRENEMMRMSPVKQIAIPAGGKAELKPGGYHLMIFGVKKPLAAGDTVQVTLTLDDGTKLQVAAEVRKMGGMR